MKTGAFLSTGFFTMILAIDMCDSIHVYGMVDEGYCRWEAFLSINPKFNVICFYCLIVSMFYMWCFTLCDSRPNYSVVPYHYYEKNRHSECKMYRVHEHTQRGGHRFITEKAIFAKWATRHKIEFKHPSWSLWTWRHHHAESWWRYSATLAFSMFLLMT